MFQIVKGFAWGICSFIAGFFCAAILAASKSE